MRTPRLFLGIFVLALLLPLLLLACGGSDEPTDAPSSGRATAEPTDLPDSERATDETEAPASPARTPSTPGSGDAPTTTDAPAAATVPPTATDTPVPAAATSPPAASGSAETDREALIALYNATGGENWDGRDTWLSDAPLGEWSGVTTNDDGRVIEVYLHAYGLSGEIPPELGNLANLQSLELESNDLSGEIPAELGSLPNLTDLEIARSGLSG